MICWAIFSELSFADAEIKRKEPEIQISGSQGSCLGGVDFEIFAPFEYKDTKYFAIFLEVEKNYKQVFHSYLHAFLDEDEQQFKADFCLSHEYLEFARLVVIYSEENSQHYEFYAHSLIAKNESSLIALNLYVSGEAYPLLKNLGK